MTLGDGNYEEVNDSFKRDMVYSNIFFASKRGHHCLYNYTKLRLRWSVVDHVSPSNLQVLKKVEALRKKVVSVGKEHASLCAQVGIYLLSKNVLDY